MFTVPILVVVAVVPVMVLLNTVPLMVTLILLLPEGTVPFTATVKLPVRPKRNQTLVMVLAEVQLCRPVSLINPPVPAV
ncbi:hypothetical protein D3C85_1347600 [compost metagenome]